jgi:hypothetical protein
LDRIPKLYETEKIPIQDKLIYLHFFIGGCHWYIAEYDGEDTFFGFSILHNDIEMAEWGYISFSELKNIKIDGWFEIDCELEDQWVIKPVIEIDKIKIKYKCLSDNL